MTQPMVGTTLSAGGFLDIHKPFVERGGAQWVAIRDNRGEATDMSPFEDDGVTVKWSPFAQDGKLRADLWIRPRVNGKFVYNENPNEGWWHTGSNTDAGGAEREPNTSSDDLIPLQSIYPVDSTVTEKAYSVSWVSLQTADPLIHRLEANQVLCDEDGLPLVPLPGAPNYFAGPTLDAVEAEYQIMLGYARRTSGGLIYRVEGYPACKLDDQAAKRRSKTDPDTFEPTYKVLPSEYFMVPNPEGSGLVPGYFGVWFGGPGWDEQYSDGGS